jgi:hypothetical protein
MKDEQEQQDAQTQETQTQSLIMDNDAPAGQTQTADNIGEEHTDEAEAASSDDQEQEATDTKEQTQTTQVEEQHTRLEDPGDFQPSDYSFDVTLADGTTVHVERPEDIAKIPQDADFGSPKNFLEVQANYTKMVNGIDTDKRAHEESKSAYSKQVEADQAVESHLQTLMSEFSYLEGNGDLPPVPAQYQNADWSDPEVAKQPGVKERIDLLNFRKEENDKRQNAGLPAIGVLETKTLMENRAFKEAQSHREQAESDMRKKRGAMVNGQSAPAPGSKSSGDMIIGPGGSLRDL